VGSYRLLIKRSAAKELERLPVKARRRIAAQIRTLSTTPRPVGIQQLSGQQRYRLRQGDYRVLYAIDDETRTVTVVAVGHRRDVYR